MKIVTVVGARPQFIKAAAVSREIAKHPLLREIIVHTGQHFDANMSDIFFEEMQIPRPDYSLNINSLNHGAMTGRMLEKIEEVLIKDRPDLVLVYGDTDSTLAGALAAKKLHIKVVHVEAGLRSFNMRMPEEINRILTDRISDVLCCPTDNAVDNLKKEAFGQFDCTIVNTGDVMQDAALFYSKLSAAKSTIINTLNLTHKEFVLCTIHRAENTDNEYRLKNIFKALIEISKDLPVVLPLHPRTQKIAKAMGLLPDVDNTKLKILNCELVVVPPVGYFDMIELLKHTKLVMTDSGGLQKEAFFFKKLCITFRDETEWVELVDNNYNFLTGACKELICHKFKELTREVFNIDNDLYGYGKASERIISLITTNNNPL